MTHSTLEIELKYYIPAESNQLVNTIIMQDNFKLIKQYFFCTETTKSILLEHLSTDELSDFDTDAKCKGRVRETVSGGVSKYTIGIKWKGRKDFASQGVVAKPELEKEIDQDLFEKLKPQANASSMIKKRFINPIIFLNKKEQSSLNVEFDLIQQINMRSLEPKFIVAEIEIPENQYNNLIDIIRSTEFKFRISDQEFSFSDLMAQEVETNSSLPFAPLVASRSLSFILKDNIPESLKNYFQ